MQNNRAPYNAKTVEIADRVKMMVCTKSGKKHDELVKLIPFIGGLNDLSNLLNCKYVGPELQGPLYIV